uniref:Uncharacterized protein n=1 Tax=Lactuca sativa TaxID=4236 RepID=A0A9R1V2A3_LACSA|nr:hypothetical protein LSAT_V11C700378800 [Lactuca sativa]
MEEDHEVPIILRRPFLNIDDSVTFGVNQVAKHSKSSDDAISSVDTIDQFLEKEPALWKVNNSKEFIFYSEEDFDAQRDLQELEKLLQGSVREDYTRSFEANLACSNQKSQYGEANKDNKKESLKKQEDTMARNDKTKPRALVSTTFEVFTFKPPDSQVYEESDTKSVISSDDEGMSENAMEIDKMEVENARQQKEEEKTKFVKRGKGTMSKYEENATQKKKEDLKKAYIRKAQAYKRIWKVKKVKKEFPLEEAATT